MPTEQLILTLVTSLVGPLLVAFVSFVGILYSLRAQHRRDVLTREEEAERLLRTYRDPLVRAAFDLQSRFYNIVVKGFLQQYVVNGTDGEREYATENTLHVVGEYFGWVEILRREIQFLDLRDVGKNRELSARLDGIGRLFLAKRDDSTFRVFRGEQRAIGEVMMTSLPNGGRECLGYASFVKRRTDAEFSRWFEKLDNDVLLLAREPGRHEQRLIDIQHALIDLLDFLDPAFQYFPESMRRKIPRPETAPAPGTSDEAGRIAVPPAPPAMTSSSTERTPIGTGDPRGQAPHGA